MCGRYAIAEEKNEMIRRYGIILEGDGVPEPNYNIAPTTVIPVVLDSAKKRGERRLEGARWSLIPPWSKELVLKFPTFNARVESAAEKPSFRGSVRNKRCIIPATGYYEWRTVEGVKTPHFVALPDDADFVPRSGMAPKGLTTLNFAGLYSWWRPEDPSSGFPPDSLSALEGALKPGGWLLTATILTREAEGPMADLHNRIPMMVPDNLLDPWLDPSVLGSQQFLDDYSSASRSVAQHLKYWPVAPVRGNAPELIVPVATE